MYSHKIKIGLAMALLGGMTACGGGGGGGGHDSGNSEIFPSPTPAGEPMGSADSTVVGPAGGLVQLQGNGVELLIPPGALQSDTTISIQSIKDMTHDGSTAYRMTPSNLQFAIPATLSISYYEQHIAGTAPELLKLAVQRSDGFWTVADSTTVNTTTHTLSTQTTQLGDWTRVAAYVLSPPEGSVQTGESQALEVLSCIRPFQEDATRLGVIPGCTPISTAIDDILPGTSPWKVNGIEGGNANVGLLEKNAADFAYTYHAPIAGPASNPVSITAPIRYSHGQQEIQLEARFNAFNANYAGTVHYTKNMSEYLDVTANINWTAIEQSDEMTRYRATGSMQGTITLPDCAPLAFSLTHEDASPENGFGEMTVYNQGVDNYYYQNGYSFKLTPVPNTPLFATCTQGSVEVPADKLRIDVMKGLCSNSGHIFTYTDVNQLADTWSCDNYYLNVQAEWNFAQQ